MKKLLLILLLAAPAAARAQITLVAHTVSVAAGGGGSTTPGINTTGANLLLFGDIGAAPYATFAPTDFYGNTWVKIAKISGGTTIATIWASFSPTVGPGHTVTTISGYGGGTFAAFSGVASGPDQVSAGIVDAYSPQASGAMTPTQAHELIFSIGGMNAGGGVTTTIASPMTLLDAASPNAQWASAYQIQGSTAATVNPTWSFTQTAMAAISATFYATIAATPVSIPSFTFPEAFVGAAYSYQIPSAGGSGTKTWTHTGTLPTGFSLSAGGLLTASSPSVAGVVTGLTFTVTDAASTTATSPSKSLTTASAPLAFTSATCPTGTQGTVYAGCNLGATGGTTPYTFGFVNDPAHVGPPEGLPQNPSTGAIAGTPTGSGVYPTTYTVTDAAGASVTQTVSIGIAANDPYGPTFAVDNFNHGGFDISALPVDTSPAAPPSLPGYVHPNFGSSASADGGIPINFVSSTQPYITTACTAATISAGNCYQMPFSSAPYSANTAIEATLTSTGDRHALTVQLNGSGQPAKLFESWEAIYNATTGAMNVDSDYYWDLTAYDWTNGAGSADAAGLCISCFLANYDQVMSAGGQKTPIRFTMPGSLELQRHVWPATTGVAGGASCTGGYVDGSGNYLILQGSRAPTSCGGGTPTRVPYGEIYRLKASVLASLPSCFATSPQSSKLAYQAAHYGIINADQGGTLYWGGTPDIRWNDSDLACLSQLPGSAFEPVNVTSLITADSNGVPLSMKVKGAIPATAPTMTGNALVGNQ